MRILITGAKGYLGKRLVKAYEKKHRVYAACRENMDFTDGEKTAAVFEEFRPEIVIHCGAVSDVGECEREPEKSFRINVQGTQIVARCCARVGARMVFCSSDQVYIEEITEKNAEAFYTPHREDEGLKPLPVYGQHKLLGERICLDENPNSVILRLTLLYDVPDEEDREKHKGMFAEDLKVAFQEGKMQQIFQNTGRGITDVREIPGNMEKVWSISPGTYNFGSTYTENMYEMIRQTFARLGKEELICCREEGMVRNMLMNTRKAEKAGIFFQDTASALYRYITS